MSGAGNELMAIVARRAMHDSAYVSKPGFCQMFVRQVMQAVFGRRYNAYCMDTAKHSAEEFRQHGLGFAPQSDTVYLQGDILYKEEGSGGFGHVGIFVGRIRDSDKPLVAENSSSRIGRVNGAKGFRTLAQFSAGGISWVVRLEPPTPGGTWEA